MLYQLNSTILVVPVLQFWKYWENIDTMGPFPNDSACPSKKLILIFTFINDDSVWYYYLFSIIGHKLATSMLNNLWDNFFCRIIGTKNMIQYICLLRGWICIEYCVKEVLSYCMKNFILRWIQHKSFIEILHHHVKNIKASLWEKLVNIKGIIKHLISKTYHWHIS